MLLLKTEEYTENGDNRCYDALWMVSKGLWRSVCVRTIRAPKSELPGGGDEKWEELLQAYIM